MHTRVPTLLTALLLLLATAVFGDDKPKQCITKWLVAGPIVAKTPVFDTLKNVKGEAFKTAELLKSTKTIVLGLEPEKGQSIGQFVWQEEPTDKMNQLHFGTRKGENWLYYVATNIILDRFQKVKFTITCPAIFEMYIDGTKASSKYSFDEPKAKEIGKTELEQKLERGNHQILIKVLSSAEEPSFETLKVQLEAANNILFDTNPAKQMDIAHVLEGTNVTGIDISDDGKYLLLGFKRVLAGSGKTENWQELRKTGSNELVMNLNDPRMSDFQFVPGKNTLSYLQEDGDFVRFMELDATTNKAQMLGRIEKINGYTWSPDRSFIIYSTNEEPDKDESPAKRFINMADRWPWYRNRSFLSKFDLATCTSSRLTWGHSSTNMQDISPNGKTLLFSVTEEDFGQRPFSKTKYYELDIQTVKAKLLFESRFGGNAMYSPDGNQLLITGSPLLFGQTGNAVTEGKTPNDYDTQAYLYRLADGKIDPLTLKFDPSIQACKWDKTGDNILFQVEEKTYVRLYTYNLATATFNQIPTQVDVVNSFDLAPQTTDIVYYGNGISTPTKAWYINGTTHEQSLVADPQSTFFKNIKFGKTEDWVYTTPEGKNIDGFINYPPDFDPTKQYPLIVFYYGGTSPIDRAFEGRYPKNLFAAMGYVVYTINPDGATGYGQDFSAMHVNNWGKTVAGQIIDGTKYFLKQHPFIDAKKVGCIGASYGGFMTMYLQTQTDIFTTAISHAGISNISSYWGVGYWGYQYSTVASADMYPWNNPDLYVKQSPLFNANKISTPILLLHGNSDTNVPPGESIQLFTALKILGKPVEMIQIEGQDHHILDYKKRIHWQKTILAWFDKYLKDQPDWWTDLYPEKNL